MGGDSAGRAQGLLCWDFGPAKGECFCPDVDQPRGACPRYLHRSDPWETYACVRVILIALLSALLRALLGIDLRVQRKAWFFGGLGILIACLACVA